MASERKERRHLTTLELDDLAWSVRRFEEQSKRDGNKKRDCDRAQRLRVLLGKLDNALIPTEPTDGE